ncbi:hypothetical protein V6Z11_D02G124600 [Gossypium hirsutum]
MSSWDYNDNYGRQRYECSYKSHGYRWPSKQYGYDEHSSLTNGASTENWSYEGYYGSQEYLHEYSYDRYGYANAMDDYNQGWSGSYSAYGSYPHIVIWRGMWRMKNISATHLLPQTDTLEAKMSSLSNLFDGLFEAVRNWCMMNAPVEESVEHDVHKSEEEVPYVNVEHDELKDDFHQKLEIRELCIELDKVVDNPVPIDVEVEV